MVSTIIETSYETSALQESYHCFLRFQEASRQRFGKVFCRVYAPVTRKGVLIGSLELNPNPSRNASQVFETASPSLNRSCQGAGIGIRVSG